MVGRAASSTVRAALVGRGIRPMPDGASPNTPRLQTRPGRAAARSSSTSTAGRALASAVMRYVKLVRIDLETYDNAQVIFETDNSRGEYGSPTLAPPATPPRST